LFSDKKTYLILNEQDGYDYQDCNPRARTIIAVQDAPVWASIFKDNPDATVDPQ